MEMNSAPSKNQKDFDAAFEKFASKLPKDYKEQFKKPDYAGQNKKQSKVVNNALKQGKQVDHVVKSTGNKAHHDNINLAEALDDSKKIDIKTVPKETSTAISKARNEKKWTQEKLANLVFEKESVIKDIENSVAPLKHDIIDKIEKALDTKLPRPWKK